MSRSQTPLVRTPRTDQGKLRTPTEQVTWLNLQIDRCDEAIAQAAENLKHVSAAERPSILTQIDNENRRLKRLLDIRDSWAFTPPRRV